MSADNSVSVHLQPTPETVSIGPAVIRWSDSRHGDNPITPETVWVKQVHGNHVIEVVQGDKGCMGEADALVTSAPGVTLSIRTADCAPIALAGDNGRVAAVHAGWKGLRYGAIEAAASAINASRIQAALGPCIHVECYEFGAEQLDDFVSYWGDSVRSDDHFDVPAAVAAECKRLGIELVYTSTHCTGHSGTHYSWRKLQSPERQVMLVRL